MSEILMHQGWLTAGMIVCVAALLFLLYRDWRRR